MSKSEASEAARKDVEEWTDGLPIQIRGVVHLHDPDLISRLTSVYARAAIADKLDEPICTMREYKTVRERAERAEADVARLRVQGLRDSRAIHARECMKCEHGESFEKCGWSSCKERRQLLAATDPQRGEKDHG